ncbi:Probable ribosomal RNA small subunit methyltransferase B [Linum grandiflorum]
MARTLSLHACPRDAASTRPQRFSKTSHKFKASVSIPKNVRSAREIQKLNLEVSPHRAVSAVRLMRIEMGGAFADLLNEKGKGSGENEMGYVGRTLGFRTKELDDRDLRLVTDVVGGTIRWRKYIDHLICSLCHDDKIFRRMEPLLVQILRIGFYEILKLEMPPYAVVDENVRLAKLALRPGAGNLVNGILRKLLLLKENDSLPLPKVEGDDRTQARALATIHSHPVWMVRRWTKYIGQEDTVRLLVWNNSDPSFSLRANCGKGVARAELVKQLDLLKTVLQAGLLKQGLCAVQDESAGMVVSVVDPQPNETIIDCCAAPGGKTLYMASLMKNKGKVYAIDVNKGRLRILKETAKVHQVDKMITTVAADLREFAEQTKEKYDKVLLDVPCSGLGVLSKVHNLLSSVKKRAVISLYERNWQLFGL